ncbi:MAG: YfiR family protein [Oligoflexia bacterium]|nr:YfiR family protein [Oligoflexia bacterium]
MLDTGIKGGLSWLIWSRSVSGLLALLLYCFPAPSSANPLPERKEIDDRPHRIKAAIVFNVMKFIRWPQESKNAGQPFNLCVVGTQDRVSRYFAETFRGQTVRGRPISLIEISDGELENSKYGPCQTIYISRHLPSELRQKVTQLLSQNMGILTICEVEAPGPSDCMLQIYESGNKAKLALDSSRINQMQLALSSELLSLAVDVSHPERSE